MNRKNVTARSLLILTTALLGVGASGCGSDGNMGSGSDARSGTGIGTTSSTASTHDSTTADSDKDNDIGAPYDDRNNNSALDYGHAASPAAKQAVTALVKRYYTNAAAGNGVMACRMIVASLANAIVEDYGHGSAGPSYLSTGTTCPAVMRLFFEQVHSQLAAELPELKVARVRLVGDHGFAIMSFGTLPEREISVGREGRTWKVQDLLDNELP